MYTLIIIMSSVFGYQMSVVTISLDNIEGLQECQDNAAYVMADPYYEAFDVESYECVPQNEVDS